MPPGKTTIPRPLALAALAALAASCAPLPAAVVRTAPGDPGTPIPGIDRCEAASPGTVDLDPERPLILLVHGCNSSGGQFRALARVFEAHGQQVLCFNYDDRDSLRQASADLLRSLAALKARMRPHRITILGHSQGGLVARRALIRERPDAVPLDDGFTYRLLTVSSPLAGIRASSDCGRPWVHYLSLGLTHVVCHGISGQKWTEIFPNAPFMERPGTLSPGVEGHVRVATDERGTCRRARPDGSCAEDDEVFSLAEQQNPAVDGDPRVQAVTVPAGHVEIVGTAGVAPLKLLELLRKQGILAASPPGKGDEERLLLARIYGTSP